jgi:hypothetical protein
LLQAPGIENESERKVCTIPPQGGTIRHERAPGFVSSRASKCAIAGRAWTESSQAPEPGYVLRDVVELALAKALVLAAEAQRWDVVAQIATELQARRENREVERSVPISMVALPRPGMKADTASG